MSGTDTAASGAAAGASMRTRSAGRNVGLRNANASAFHGGVRGKPAEAVAAAGAVDQRIIRDGRQHPQLRIDAAQQVPQVVVLAEKGVKSAIHREFDVVIAVRSSRRPGRRGSSASPRPRRRHPVRRARSRPPIRRCRRRRPPRAAAQDSALASANPGGAGCRWRRRSVIAAPLRQTSSRQRCGRRCVPSPAWFHYARR